MSIGKSSRIAPNKVSRRVIAANHIFRGLLEDSSTPAVGDSACDLLAAFPDDLGKMTSARGGARLVI